MRSAPKATGIALKAFLAAQGGAKGGDGRRAIRTVENQRDKQATTERAAFSFGRNWQDFVDHHLDLEREQTALKSMKEFLELPNLQNLSFCDLGCGSGLFSLVAHRLGARSIISIDVDPFSVRCCEELRQRVKSPANWVILQGSVLDREFLSQVERADIVYAWGSLHHTGNMWQAIHNAADMVQQNGLLYLSIYNKVEGRRGSEHFLRVKRLYNRSPRFGKFLLELAHALRSDIMPRILRLQNPFTFIKNYSRNRGMSYWTDLRDWLGGYPYEFASANDIFRVCYRELRLELRNLRVTNTLGTNEFLFQKKSD